MSFLLGFHSLDCFLCLLSLSSGRGFFNHLKLLNIEGNQKALKNALQKVIFNLIGSIIGRKR
jgi:molybdopterin biosynthesis enzyme MoaB